jgi:hypothetical protein
MTPTEVEERLEEAVRTLRRLPDHRPLGYFNTWPIVVRSAWEIACMEKRPMKVLATPESISRMEECFGWLFWLSADDARIVWMRAEKASFRVIAHRLGMSRMMAWRRWAAALVLISTRLSTPEQGSMQGMRQRAAHN